MAKRDRTYRTFNTSGLCFPDKHYMVDPLNRLKEVETLIREELYFTIHAPRQTGKTTFLYALARKLNGEGEYTALVVSFEQAGYAGASVERAHELLLHSIYEAAVVQLPEDQRPGAPNQKKYLNLKDYLTQWARECKRPIVLFADETDALLDDVLVAVLRQLRDGYQTRPNHFPSSVVLVGLRDVRDYKVKVREELKSYGAASPFNIKSDSLFLRNFTREEVQHLLGLHGKETGQFFPPEVTEEIFRLSSGQPWLTNAMARQITAKILAYDFSRPITMELLGEAKQQLILRRDTHLDSLMEKLKEGRVKRIVQAIINGDNLSFDILEDDIVYARDLGIVGETAPLRFSNPIYAEIIPRVMSTPMQFSIPGEVHFSNFLTKAGTLDMLKVLEAFQAFYRRNADSWLQRYEYRESAQHLLLMAFLQRVINAGGEIVREMAVGNGRIDLLVRFGPEEFALELKINRHSYTLEDGKEQLCGYLDRLGLKQGYLIVFEPGDKSWDEKIFVKKLTHKGKTIFLVGI